MQIFGSQFPCRDYVEIYIKSKDNFIVYERNRHIKELDKPYIVDIGDYIKIYMNKTDKETVLKIIREVCKHEVLRSSKRRG